MPDIQMCLGQDCEVARNCRRCPMSGTVATPNRQVWGPIPGGDASCPMYDPIDPKPQTRENHKTVHDAMERVITHFLAVYGSTSTAQYTPDQIWDQFAEGFWHAVAFNDEMDKGADDACDWLKTKQLGVNVYDTILMAILGVASILDSERDNQYYTTILEEGVMKAPRHSAQIMPERATVN